MKGKSMGNYTILSGNTKLTQSSDKIIQTCRSFENKDGNIVKVILISEVATEGVDFKNVREIHIVEPWYNLSKIEQIIGRGVRNNSHVNLDKLKRNVTIYQHVNLLPKHTHKESVDFRTYRIAEKKQLKISQVERILKESSIDCPLNKEVLFFNPKDLGDIKLITSQNNEIQFQEGDLPNSRMCDYTSCEIECDAKLTDIDITKNINHELMEYEINNTHLKVQNFMNNNKINAFEFEEHLKMRMLMIVCYIFHSII
jgi:superfamily II DNA or RNA helicase